MKRSVVAMMVCCTAALAAEVQVQPQVQAQAQAQALASSQTPSHKSSPAPAPHRALHALFAEEWERSMREVPERATFIGDTRYNDRWSDLSLPAIERRQAAERSALRRLHAIGRKGLNAADQLNYDTFEWDLLRNIERQKFREYLRPVSHQGGPQTADGVAEGMPFANAADYRQWLARMAGVPQMLAHATALMREGVQAGLMPPRVLMARVPAQIAAQIVEAPERSPFYRPFLHMPGSMAAAERSTLQAQAQATLREHIVPAYRQFQAFFNAEYLPQAPQNIAASSQPDGAAYYDFLARTYTTTSLSAEQIHAIGLQEVARLRVAMEAVKVECGFAGTLDEFNTFLRTDPRFFLATPAQLLAAYREVAKRIDPELVKVIRTLPRLPYGVRAIPDHVAPDTTTAYYQPGAADGTRPGWYTVNLYKPETRPTWEMVPLTLHESVPGHHLQFARAIELAGAPMFRRTAYFVAYGEGWGLYAERLGYEMGLYDNPYDRYGQLTYEMWRAVRLVVDTGMHAKGWSRERAISYFKANAAKTEQDIVNEVDRYIGTPGQALAYKIGQMKISELRERSERELGAAFDLRDFNDAVLATGSVPLGALEAHIDEWIAARRVRR